MDGMNYNEIGEATGIQELLWKLFIWARHLFKESVKKYLGKEEILWVWTNGNR